MTAMRKRIAARLVEAQQQTAMVKKMLGAMTQPDAPAAPAP